MEVFDVAVIGGGILGLATSLALKREHPELAMVVLEKEHAVAQHQTGHNSGVVHSGIYYRPGSLKAKLCTEGVKLLEGFCEEHGVGYERCGKIIVATQEEEIPRLEVLYARGLENGVPNLEMIDPERLQEIEPFAAGLKAIYSANTAIVDYSQVAGKLAELLQSLGLNIETNAKVIGIHRQGDTIQIRTPHMMVRSRYLVNCAGLYADTLARLAGAAVNVSIVPFRGEYYLLRREKRHLVRGMIYPVPDPSLPFLGVHLTRTIHGEVEAGPNAVLAFAREGYTLGRLHLGELGSTFATRGFWSLARRYWRTSAYEFYRSLSKPAFVKALQRLVPSLRIEDVIRAGAGVRAQAVGPDGSLLDDFVIAESENALHVVNAPSPAATASLSIGRYLAGICADRFAL